MQTPSAQLAEILVDKAIVTMTIRPRSVPVTCKCTECGGSGEVLRSPSGYSTDPRAVPVECSTCSGDGVETIMCERLGHGAATVVLFDDDGKASHWCDECVSHDEMSAILEVLP